MLQKRLRNQLQKGFTLIELMVVVSIIGILMAAGILAFTNAQQTARDAKRRADVDAISKAEEQYNAANNGAYPLAAAITSAITTYFPSGALPVDPKTAAAYTVTATASSPNTAYCVCAALEKANSGNATSAGAAGVCAYGTGTGANWFCASQRQ